MTPPAPTPPADISRAQLLALAGPDPWVRWGSGAPAEVFLAGDGVAVVARPGRRGGTGAWLVPLRPGRPAGAPPAKAELVAERRRVLTAARTLVDHGLVERWRLRSASVPLEHADAVRAVLPLSDVGGDWDWMWTTAQPAPDPREELLVELDDGEHAAELRSFAHTHNPRVWTRIGEGHVVRWVGVRDADGSLLAVGGAEEEDSGVPHLAGILTARHARGQGWGQVVSSALTRWAVRRDGVCTLGMFSDNDTARRLYRRLGYRTARSWHSRQLEHQDTARGLSSASG